MNFFRQVLEYIRRTFGNMTGTQKTILVALAGVIILAIVWGSLSATSNGWVKIVDATVDPAEQEQIRAKLKEKGFQYQIKEQSIFVPKEVADEAVMQLHGEGLFNDAMLWAFLDDNNLTKSKSQQEKRYQVALQHRIEKMIRSMEAIKNAAVQLTPGDDVFRDGFRSGSPPKASVALHLKTGKELKPENVKAIANLVANAMTGLNPWEVAITDSTGKPYRVYKPDEVTTAAVQRREIEEQYAQDLRNNVLGLYPIALVRANVEISLDSSEEVSDSLTGEPKVINEVKNKESEKNKATQEQPGIKGEGQGGGGPTSQSETDRKEESNIYFLPKKNVKTRKPGGSIKRKSIAVFLPFPAEKMAEEVNRIPQHILAIQQATGITEAGAVTVQIVEAPKRPDAPTVTAWEHAAEFFDRYGRMLILLAVAAIALYIIYRLLKAAVPKGVMEDIEQLREQLAAESTVGTPELRVAETELARMKQGIREMVQKNPRGVASVLRKWMTGK